MNEKYLRRVYSLFRQEDGAIAVIMAFVMVAFLCVCAIVIDLGMIYSKRSSLQSAIDSAALAGAYQLPDTVSATQQANEYIVKNGFSATDINIVFEYNNTVIRINASKRFETSFAKVFNVDYVDVTANASAKVEIKPIEKAFEYLIFSGSSTATLNLGGTFEIYGSVHSNGNLSASPAYGYIQGSAESCKSYYVNPYTTTVGTKVLNAPFIEMADLTEETSQVFPVFYETVLDGATYSKKSAKQYFTGNTKIIGNCTLSNQAVVTGNLYVDGDLIIGGGAPACQLDGNIYATGNISFTNTFSGSGCVFAKGNILFQGGGALFSADSPICLYSETGNISLTTATSEIHGMIYAPHGTINIQGGETSFFGSIIGNQITGIPSKLKMYLLDVELPFESVKTTTRLVE